MNPLFVLSFFINSSLKESVLTQIDIGSTISIWVKLISFIFGYFFIKGSFIEDGSYRRNYCYGETNNHEPISMDPKNSKSLFSSAISIISTPRGVMSDAEARAANVGGEVLCRVF